MKLKNFRKIKREKKIALLKNVLDNDIDIDDVSQVNIRQKNKDYYNRFYSSHKKISKIKEDPEEDSEEHKSAKESDKFISFSDLEDENQQNKRKKI